MRFFAIEGGITFNSCYDDAQDRQVVTLRMIDAVCAAVNATDIFKQTDDFTLLAEQGPVKDVADALKAKLTETLARRCLEASGAALSSSSREARRRVLDALKKATEDKSLKMLPQSVSAKKPDSWRKRFEEAGVSWTIPRGYKVPKRGEWKGSFQPLANKLAAAALKKFDDDNVEGSAAARDAAATQKRNLARGDYSAVVEVLEEMLRRKITAVGSDEVAVAKWLTKTAERAASKFLVHVSTARDTLSATEIAEIGRAGAFASNAAQKKLDLGREKKNGTAQSNLEPTTRSCKDKLDRMRSGRRLAGI